MAITRPFCGRCRVPLGAPNPTAMEWLLVRCCDRCADILMAEFEGEPPDREVSSPA